MSIDVVIDRYVKLRDRKAELKKEYDASVANIDLALERIENALLKEFKRQQANSISTPHGTAYTQKRTAARVADWDEALAWIKRHDAWDMLKRDVAKSSVEQYRNEHNDVPPGINWSETLVVNVRRT